MPHQVGCALRDDFETSIRLTRELADAYGETIDFGLALGGDATDIYQELMEAVGTRVQQDIAAGEIGRVVRIAVCSLMLLARPSIVDPEADTIEPKNPPREPKPSDPPDRNEPEKHPIPTNPPR